MVAGALGAQTYEDLFAQAAALSARRDYAGAAARYEAALKLRPGAVEALSNLAVIHHAASKYAEAVAVARMPGRKCSLEVGF